MIRILGDQAGVQLTAAASGPQVMPGSWRRVAADVLSADPGRSRLYLQSAQDGGRAREALYEAGLGEV